MIAVLRINGMVDVRKDVRETLDRLRLRKKLVCVLIDEKDEIMMGMVKSVRDYVAYGTIDDEMAKKIISSRGKFIGEKDVEEKDAEKILGEIKKGTWKIKRFFRLHPPRGGFRKSTQKSYPKGILGKHEDISKLLERML